MIFMRQKEFESKTSFRLIKVLYIIGLVSFFILALGVAKTMIPTNVVDTSRSYIKCEDRTTYSFEELRISNDHINRYSPLDGGYESDGYNAWIACKDKTDKYLTKKGFSLGDFEVSDTKVPNPDYEVVVNYKLDKSWLEPIGGFVVVFLSSYVLSSIIREILFYILFAKNFSWNWLNPFRRNGEKFGLNKKSKTN